LRHFYLWKHIFALEVREKIEEAVLKVKPVFDPISSIVKEFQGWSLMSLEIKDFTVFEIEKPKLGKVFPEKVLAEISYSIVEMNANVKKEWEKLKPHDVIFLVSFKEKNSDNQIENELQEATFIERNNITRIRGCELQSHLDEDRRKINPNEFKTGDDFKAKGLNRYLQVHLDPSQYNVFRNDTNNEKFNIAVRRNLKDLNFNVFLKLILRILETNLPVKEWIQQVIIGKANNTDHVQQEMKKSGKKITLNGVFINEKHYKETFSSNKSLHDIKEHFNPPVYSPERTVRYTPEQVEGIALGLLPGIHLIHGPPGTGKTEICLELVVQALANFPDKRILIVSHSTSAIDDLFAKLHRSGKIRSDQIMKLGQTESKSDSEVDFTRFGRINHMLKTRLELIAKIEQLSRDIDVDMTNRLTCETASIFLHSQINGRWDSFCQKSFKDKIELLSAYPFSKLILLQWRV
jgi:intron-binding protein aquarius